MRPLSFIAVSLILSLTLSVVALSSYSVQAATYYVDVISPCSGSGTMEDPYCKIQYGIDTASPGDTVEVAAGTYYEKITMKSGVVIQGAGQGVSIINGGGSGSVVTATGGVDSAAKLDGFTITNGSGGGMYNSFYSSPTVTNCTFSGNTASGSNGGGMYNVFYSSPTVTNCTFSGNSAGWSGGGIYNDNYSSPTVTNCTFSGNYAVDSGGGMSNNNNSSPTVTNCTFIGNNVTTGNGSGGGMHNDYASPTVTNCTFSENDAGDSGGGMYNNHSLPAVTNCTFIGNNAFYGGGMDNNTSSPTVTNCTFSGNSAVFGGGMYNENSSPTLINSILWGDTPDEIHSVSSTLFATYSDIQGGGYTGTGNIDADPMFVDPGNGDFHLQQGSPCIDAGDNSAPNLPLTDIDGEDRKIDDPAVVDTGNGTAPIVDMGVDEYYKNEPFASFTANPNPAACNQSVFFDASVSYHGDLQRSIVSYEWDWESDGNYDATGVTQTHAFSTFGSYTVKLRVTDDNDPPKTDTDTVVIDVNQGNQAPVSDADGPYISIIGADVQLDGSGSSDPNAGCGDSIVNYEWDLDNDGQFDDATGANPTIMWATIVSLGLGYPGVVNSISLRVTDSFGATSTDTTTLTIYDNQPSASFTANPNPAACTQSVFFDASGSSHGNPQRSIVLYEWDWESDGNYDATGVTQTHAFSAFGSYTVKLRVTDDNYPPKTDTDTVVIDVNQGNQAPVSDADGPYISIIGADVPLDGSGSWDPNAGCGDSIVSYEWDLDNDGQFDDATGANPQPVTWATIVSLGLSYPGVANSIGLRVTDSFGATSTDTTTLTIYTDSDGDGIADHLDNCPDLSNPDQANQDQDDAGDACDGCPTDSNKTDPGICGCGVADTDSDNDGTPDCNDACPNDPGKTEPGECGCGIPDIDSDQDGILDCNDAFPNDPNYWVDTDSDQLPDNWEQQIVDFDPNDEIETLDNVLPDDDFDGDGWSNIIEYKRGTDPTDPGSHPSKAMPWLMLLLDD